MRRFALPAILGALLVTAPLAAQTTSSTADAIPPGHRPPAGMCRIWIDGVPPGQQSAPTDCATAIRNRPANGRVIFGDEDARPAKKRRLPLGSFGIPDSDKLKVRKLRDEPVAEPARTDSTPAKKSRKKKPHDR